MGLSIGCSTCGIYRGVQSYQRAELCLLPAISPPRRLIIVFLALTFTRNQVPVGVVINRLKSAFQVGNIIIVIILSFRLLFKVEVKVEGRPNSNSKGVNPLADCTVVLYT